MKYETITDPQSERKAMKITVTFLIELILIKYPNIWKWQCGFRRMKSKTRKKKNEEEEEEEDEVTVVVEV